MNFQRLSTAQRASAIAIAAVVVGAFLPWVSILGISVMGLEADGALTLFLALAGAVTLLLTSGVVGKKRKANKGANVALLVLASFVTLVGIVDMNGSAAIGLYLTLFGGLSWLIGAAWQVKSDGWSGFDPSNGPAGQH